MFYFRAEGDPRPTADLPRFATLDELSAYEADVAEAKAELEAEARNERWFEERGGSTYAGSPEEARVRWLDSLAGV